MRSEWSVAVNDQMKTAHIDNILRNLPGKWRRASKNMSGEEYRIN